MNFTQYIHKVLLSPNLIPLHAVHSPVWLKYAIVYSWKILWEVFAWSLGLLSRSIFIFFDVVRSPEFLHRDLMIRTVYL